MGFPLPPPLPLPPPCPCPPPMVPGCRRAWSSVLQSALHASMTAGSASSSTSRGEQRERQRQLQRGAGLHVPLSCCDGSCSSAALLAGEARAPGEERRLQRGGCRAGGCDVAPILHPHAFFMPCARFPTCDAALPPPSRILGPPHGQRHMPPPCLACVSPCPLCCSRRSPPGGSWCSLWRTTTACARTTPAPQPCASAGEPPPLTHTRATRPTPHDRLAGMRQQLAV